MKINDQAAPIALTLFVSFVVLMCVVGSCNTTTTKCRILKDNTIVTAYLGQSDVKAKDTVVLELSRRLNGSEAYSSWKISNTSFSKDTILHNEMLDGKSLERIARAVVLPKNQ